MRRLPVALPAILALLAAVPSAAAVLTVSPSNTQGWTISATASATVPPSAAYLAPGFETPPLGAGSLHLAIGANGNDASQARHAGYTGTRIDAITELSYYTYVDVDGSGGQAPYLMLHVDRDGNLADATDAEIWFFEPLYQSAAFFPSSPQGPLALHTWQFWNALTGGWYSTSGLAGSGPGANVKTFTQLLAAAPNATIRASGTGGVRIVTGFGAPPWNNFSGAADAFTIGVSGSSDTYDFEPEAGTVVTVTTADPDGWSLQTVNEGGPTNTATIDIVPGPGTPPMGDGSLQLSVGADGADAAQAVNSTYNGQLLRDLSSLTYWTYVDVDGSGGQAPYIILDVDYDNNGTRDDILFFEPVYQTAGFFPTNPQPALALDTWQQWDARNGGWWSVNGTGGAGPGVNVEPLGTIIDAEPDAEILNVRIVAGFGAGAWDNFLGYADALAISFATPTTTYDFEPIPTISIDDVTQFEGTGGTTNFVFTLTLSNPVSQSVTVDYTTADGTALAADADYTPVTVAATATFTPQSTTTTITIAVGPDTKFEPDETFFVNLTNPQNATIAPGETQATGTIQNDDTQPTISIDDQTQAELDAGTAPMTFNVTLSNASFQTITVDYTITGVSATLGTDFTASNGTLTFVPNDTSESITVQIVGDTIFEGDETFTVTLSNPTNSTILDGTATGTITDDDDEPTISIADSSATEGDAGTTPMTFTVTLSNPSASTITVDYTTADLLGGAVAGTDYTTTAGTLTFVPGDTSETFNVSVIGDLIDEPNETFNVNLSNPTNATILDGTAVGTITDDDDAPTISIADSSATEGDAGTTPMTFTVTLSNPSASTITVDYTTADILGGAVAGADYTLTAGTLTFVPGDTSETFDVPVIGDLIDEPNETFNANLSNPTNATILDGTAVGTITDDDDAPTISIADSSATEGDAGTTPMTFTVTLSNPSASTITVDFTTADIVGGAVAGTDYTTTASTLTFAPGDTSETFVVPVIGDLTDEPNETFNVNLSNPTNATIFDGTAIGTIIDNDPVPTISIADSSASEGDAGTTPMTFTVTLSNPSTSTITVDYSTADIVGQAVAGTDYTATSGTLTFAPGDTSETFDVPVIGDLTDEANETFNVNLTNPTVASIADGTAVGTIIDDDGVPTISIADSSATEGDAGTTPMTFTVTLSNPSVSTITVDYSTADIVGEAVAGTDYTATSGTLTFAPGDTSETFDVAVIGDLIDEPNETFNVNLTNPTVASIADGTAVGTIIDDDGVPTISIADSSATEGDAGTTPMTFTVTLSNPSASTITVDYATANIVGGAVAGTDYTATSGTLTFAPGDLAETFDVAVIGDLIDEPNETFNVNLTNPANAAIADGTAIGTITDDDGVPAITITDSSVTEGDAGTTPMTFTVTLSNPSASTVTVDYTTADVVGGAVAGVDYTTTAGTLTFAPGDTSETFDVPVIGDLLDEPNETFNVNLSNPANATIGDGTAVGTINDNDGAPSATITDVSQNEGNAGTTTFTFTVTLSSASALPVTIDYSTAGDTATSGTDFTAESGTVIINAGLTGTITIDVIGDVAFEPNERFFVNLTNPQNATIADPQGEGTILNDDGAVADVSIEKTGPSGAVPPGGQLNYTITVTNAGPQTASNVVVTDILPAGTSLISATPSQGSCTGTTTVICTLGAIPDDGSATIQLLVNAPTTEGTVSNTATVANTPETDPTPANNASTVVANTAFGIPTMSEWGLLALLAALMGLAVVKLR